jgi:hypothetical protein
LKVTFRRAYGHKHFKTTEIALHHSLSKLPEPDFTHRFFWRGLLLESVGGEQSLWAQRAAVLRRSSACRNLGGSKVEGA